MSRVVHFEIHATNPPQLVEFYSAAFGWQFHKWDGPAEYWLIKTGSADQPGIDGGLMRRHGQIDGTAVLGYVCTIDVANIDDTAAKIVGLGGTVALPKMPVPGVGWLAYFKDLDSNVFGCLERDPRAGL